MVDANERFDGVDLRLAGVERGLDDLNGHVGKLDGRLGKVEGRLDGIDGRLDSMDRRFDSMDRRFDSMDQRMASLEGDVRKLRVLGEENAGQIKLIAEVQSHHGKKLDDLVKAVEPLKDLPNLIHIVGNHERRITALERNSHHTAG